LQKEVQVHAVLKHPHVLQFIGVEERGVSKEERARYLPGIYIVLDLAGGGDLFDKISE
jgi:serine/threonine-protein kinase Chk1